MCISNFGSREPEIDVFGCMKNLLDSGREYDYFKTGSRISAIPSKFVAISSGILVWNCLPSSHGLPVNSGLYIMDTISHMRTEYAD